MASSSAKKTLKTINVDLPGWMVTELDEQAEALGISRKALINVLLATILERKRSPQKNASKDKGYIKAINDLLAPEWLSKEDEEAFRDL